jgi:hypothetical protein
MRKCLSISIALLVVSLLLGACAASKVGSATKNEALVMTIKEQQNVIDPERLTVQKIPSLNDRALAQRGQSRGMLAPVAGSLVSMASNAVKKMIATNQTKYVAAYQFGLTDLYFYDQLSTEGPFDPVGMQFNGFKLVRTFTNGSGANDTALMADFVLDTANSAEIFNNSVFRLRLNELKLRYAKAKVARGDKKKMNLDFEINLRTSYVASNGAVFDNVVIGKFYLLLRGAPLDQTQPGYAAYYEGLKDSLLTGRSFIIPRSFGYHRDAYGEMKQSFSQGAYSIEVKVKESSKNNFVSRLLFENAAVIIDASRDQLKTKLKNL